MQKATTAYFQTQVTTTSQGDLVVMLYDGAIKFLGQAKQHLLANDVAKKGIAISKALDVINELDSSLNMEKGGDLSVNLHSLYLFCSNHLVKANIRKDPKMIDEVLRVLTGLRSAYAEILSRPEAQAAAQEVAANMHANAILPSRNQLGASPSGAATPAPGAGARQRNLYSKAAGQQQATAPDAGMEGAAGQPAVAQPSQAAVKPAEATPQPPAPPLHAAATAVAQNADTPQAPSVPDDQAPGMQGFAGAANFARRQAGANLYRKFSGQ